MCIKAYHSISRHIKAYQSISKIIKDYQSISNNIKYYQNIKHIKVYQNISKHIEVSFWLVCQAYNLCPNFNLILSKYIQIVSSCWIDTCQSVVILGAGRADHDSWRFWPEIRARNETVEGPPIDPFGSAPKWGTPKWIVSNGISFEIDDLEAPPWWETPISWEPYKLKRGSPLQLMANVDMDARHNTSLSCPNTQHVSFFGMISLTLFPAAPHVSARCASCRVVWPQSTTCLWLPLSEKPNQWNYPQCRDIRQSESFPHGSTTKLWGLGFGSFGLTPTRAGQPGDVQPLRKHDVRGHMISFSPLGKNI